jgi:transposase
MDNLAAHTLRGSRELIEATGASLLYLPPCSPDLNPIELLFAKLNHLLRSAAARTIDGLWIALGACLDQIRSDECRRHIQHCGYGHPT